LDLSFNKLRALPKEIAGLKALKSLRVASNKLVELPSELSELPNLTSIDVAHNRLTSFDSLGLESMSSLRALNAQVPLIARPMFIYFLL
jgi:Leucine-rich repeat (LRR) protein